MKGNWLTKPKNLKDNRVSCPHQGSDHYVNHYRILFCVGPTSLLLPLVSLIVQVDYKQYRILFCVGSTSLSHSSGFFF